MGRNIDETWKSAVWGQFGAALETLERAILACPPVLWGDRSRRPEYWYTAYHALFWLDLYLSEAPYDFAPPEPFGLEELDPAGLLPGRVYEKEELLTYLEHGRARCRKKIENLTGEESKRIFEFGTIKLGVAELLLYNMRHVQHHAAQLNVILRQTQDSAPRWIRRAER
jgi:hypothetical protein